MSWSRSSRLILAGAALTALVPVAACGSSQGSAGSSASAPTAPDFSQHGPITFARAKDNTGYAPKEVAAWNAAHPDEQVTLRDLPDSADQQRQQIIQNAQIKSDDISVVTTDVVWTAELAAKGFITELPADKFSMQGVLPAAAQTAVYFNKLYAVPGDSNGGLLYYRKDLLEAAGDKPPTTWAQLKKVCADIKAEPGNAKLDCYGGQFDKYEGLTVNFAEAVDSAGGAVVDASGQPTVNTPQAAQGLDFLTSSFKDGTIPKAAITWEEEQGRQAFQDGNLIFLRNWPYVYGLAGKATGSKVAGKFDVAPLPGLSGQGVSSLGGLNFAIPTYAKNKGTAIDFITYLSSHDEQKKRSLASANPPTLEALYTDPDMVKQYPYLPTLLQVIKTAQPRPKVVRYGDLTLAVQNSVYDALQGTTPSDQALTTLQTTLQTLVK
jgi:multiple sugar transport system substrate-binding protein